MDEYKIDGKNQEFVYDNKKYDGTLKQYYDRWQFGLYDENASNEYRAMCGLAMISITIIFIILVILFLSLIILGVMFGRAGLIIGGIIFGIFTCLMASSYGNRVIGGEIKDFDAPQLTADPNQ